MKSLGQSPDFNYDAAIAFKFDSHFKACKIPL